MNANISRWEELKSHWDQNLGDFKVGRKASDALAKGLQLIMLKESCPHGTWVNEINRRGIPNRTAATFMACWRRFHEATPEFLESVGCQSRLSVLLPLSPKQCNDLMQGHPVNGLLTLKTIRSMTVRDLRKTVSKVRELDSVDDPTTRPVRVEAVNATVSLPGQLTVEEDRMLRLFRQADAKTREALFLVAELQARP